MSLVRRFRERSDVEALARQLAQVLDEIVDELLERLFFTRHEVELRPDRLAGSWCRSMGCSSSVSEGGSLTESLRSSVAPRLAPSGAIGAGDRPMGASTSKRSWIACPPRARVPRRARSRYRSHARSPIRAPARGHPQAQALDAGREFQRGAAPEWPSQAPERQRPGQPPEPQPPTRSQPSVPPAQPIPLIRPTEHPEARLGILERLQRLADGADGDQLEAEIVGLRECTEMEPQSA